MLLEAPSGQRALSRFREERPRGLTAESTTVRERTRTPYRHSCATGALKAGVSPKVISERIGRRSGYCCRAQPRRTGRVHRAANRSATRQRLSGDPCSGHTPDLSWMER